MLSFIIIQLPPGDYITSYIAQMSASGSSSRRRRRRTCASCTASTSPTTSSTCAGWVRCSAATSAVDGVAPAGGRGDRRSPGADDRAVAVRGAVHLGLALPIGIYSAVRQYSIGDYIFTFIGFIGLAVPNFLLALILMYFGFACFGTNIGGLFSEAVYRRALEPGQVHATCSSTCALPALILALGGTAAAHPDHARQPARRAAQALCRHRPRQGAAGAQAAPEVPGARRPQPVRQHDRLPLPLHRLRQHHRLARAEPADRSGRCCSRR